MFNCPIATTASQLVYITIAKITQPISSADIVTTVSPGTHQARVNITMPTAKTVEIFFIFLSFYRYWRPGQQILHPFLSLHLSLCNTPPGAKKKRGVPFKIHVLSEAPPSASLVEDPHRSSDRLRRRASLGGYPWITHVARPSYSAFA